MLENEKPTRKQTHHQANKIPKLYNMYVFFVFLLFSFNLIKFHVVNHGTQSILLSLFRRKCLSFILLGRRVKIITQYLNSFLLPYSHLKFAFTNTPSPNSANNAINTDRILDARCQTISQFQILQIYQIMLVSFCFSC